jgi:hypothetical protein
MTVQTVELQMFYGGAFQTVPLYSGAGTTIERSAVFPTPTKVTCEINNDDLAYDPSRPQSPLYGLAGRNTLSRVLVNGTSRVRAEASEWVPDKTAEHQPAAGLGRAWVSLTAEGILRRIGKWSDPLRSPMFRTITGRTTSVGHWPLEDERGATQASATVGDPAYTTGIQFGADDAPAGAVRAAEISDGSLIAGRFAPASSNGWQVAFSFKFATAPSTATYVPIMSWTTTNGIRWDWDVNNANYRFSVHAADDTLISAITSGFGFDALPNSWITYRLKASVSGGTVTYEPAWYAQNGTVWGITNTYAGSLGALREFRQIGVAGTDGSLVSHVYGVVGVTDDLLNYEATRSFDGYLGETAGARFIRLCDQVGVGRFMLGTAAESAPMGRQRADTFLALLQEIVDTDDCLIYDDQFTISLVMRTRRNMVAQTASLALTYPGQVAVPLRKRLDDSGIHNRVTVSNALGGEATAVEAVGPVSVQPPPAGVGEYKQTIDVNVGSEPAQLAPLAGWYLNRGTIDGPRYDEVTVDLLANPGLAASINAVVLGDLITITGAAPDVISLRVLAMTERIEAVEWSMTFKTEPYEPWAAGRYDSTAARYDVANSTVGVARDAVQTAWTFAAAAAADLWSVTSLPYDLMVAGERIRVTAISGPIGTGPYTQTATVTRSINGVAKSHIVGEPVHIATPGRYGL